MKEHERKCFVQKTELSESQIVPYSLLDGPPPMAIVKNYDAIMVGGSGDFDVSKENLPFYFDFLEFMHACVAHAIPLFGSCFGYQCLVSAMGGKVIYDPQAAEVGTLPLRLTPEGRADPLFTELPEEFGGSMGHKDRTLMQPGGIPNLAQSERCPYQALRIPGKPIWATQFHPELDGSTNLDRFSHYLTYSSEMSEAEIQSTRNRFQETPEAATILRRFLEIVFG